MKYEIEYEVKANKGSSPASAVAGLFSLMSPDKYKGRQKETVTAFSEAAARKQLESKYKGKTVIIHSCRVVF